MTPEYIILHHSLTKDSGTVSAHAIKRYHVDTLGWDDVGYHYLVELVDDEYIIYKGRKDAVQGAHTLGMNENSLGICCVGNFDVDEFPPAQMNATKILIAALCNEYRIPLQNVRRHHDYNRNKSCPGRTFPFELLLIGIYDCMRVLETQFIDYKESYNHVLDDVKQL